MSRISPGTLLVGVIAIVAGLVGAYLARENMKPDPVPVPVAEVVPPVLESLVPITSLDLKSGRKIAFADIEIQRLTREQMIDRGINKAYMQDSSQIIGRVLRKDLTVGTTFSPQDFYPEGTGPNIADHLQPGMRAITVPVDLDSAVAGFASPGTWVDVVFRSEAIRAADSDEHPSVAITMLERVKVLAVEEETTEGIRVTGRAGAARSSAVTLQVDPEGVAALRLVEGRGSLALSLRNPEDDSLSASVKPVSMTQLLNLPTKAKHEMQVFRGNRMSRVGFESETEGETMLTRLADFQDNRAEALSVESSQQQAAVNGNQD